MITSSYPRINYGATIHDEREVEAVVRVLRSSTQMGAQVGRFEQQVASLFGKRHGVMVNSGSSALMLALRLPEFPAGSEVITPALTFATTVAAVLHNGLVPVFADVVPGTFCIDPGQLQELLSSKTRAVLVPNLIGNLAPWPALRAFCDAHGLLLIEDSADTLGATLEGVPSGRFADLSITSFYGSHVINCAGNGGMLCLDDDRWARRARILRSWGRSSSVFSDSEDIEARLSYDLDGIAYDAKFVFEEVGYNFEPSEMGAAFGLVQLERLQENIAARERNFASHRRFFQQFERDIELPLQTDGSRTGWLAFPMVVRDTAPFTRKALQRHLESHNIQTRVVFTGNILRQPGFRDIPRRIRAAGYPVADAVTRGGLLIGCHHGLTTEQIDRMHSVAGDFLRSAVG